MHPILLNDWEKLLSDEREARAELFRSTIGYGEEDVSPSGPDKDLLRSWWELVSKILTYCAVEPSVYPPPIEIFLVLSKFSWELSKGSVPEPIADVATRGENPLRYTELRHIGWAVRYMQIVREGKYRDRAPNRTICEAFGVGESTVRGWVRDHAGFVLSLVEYKTDDGDVVRDKMLECGAAYVRRGHRSVAARFGRRR